MGYRGSLNFINPVNPDRSTLGNFGFELDSRRFISSYAAGFSFHSAAKSSRLPFASSRWDKEDDALDRAMSKSQSDSALRSIKLDPLSKESKTSKGDSWGSRSGLLPGIESPAHADLPSNPRQLTRRNATIESSAYAALQSNPRQLKRRNATTFTNSLPPLRAIHEKCTKVRENQRKVMELLTDPDVELTARRVFAAHDAKKNNHLSFDSLRSVLQSLHLDLGLPNPDYSVAERLFKKFDIDNSKTLEFKEFLELFLSILRRSAFDRYTLFGRNFFVNKSQGDVWDDHKKKKQMGGGSFGTAFLVKTKHSNEKRVVKIVKKTRLRMPVQDVEGEIMIMRQIDHPHVVRLFTWYEDDANIYLVMEALTGGTLNQAIVKFQDEDRDVHEAWVRTVIRQVIEGMAYCHSLRLIHKDLKDENIMLLKSQSLSDEPFAVIIDLGIAEMFSVSDPHNRQISGTPYTMAPEVWMGNYGPKCDVYSVGCVLFSLLGGSLPFILRGADYKRPQAWIRLHRTGPSWGMIRASSEGTALCKAMLSFSEDDRPSMQNCLTHEWFSLEKHTLGPIKKEQFIPLQQFCKATALKRSLLLEIASRLPMGSAGKIVEIFETFDSDKSGEVSLAELKSAFHSMGLNDDGMAERTFDALDVDKNGSLSFSEFTAGVLPLFTDLLDDRLHTLFMDYDLDNDGALDHAELEKFLANSAALLKENTIARSASIIQSLLQDGHGVRYEELREKLLDYGIDDGSSQFQVDAE
eukprot:gnl/MRDRNA2_/MRDRNA2_96155_c0_seq1.p1 gnl/MRDRNA2_/MRDRNA2_96155_c0~~gnl/MRDRNA2_/MRDRNA2_96155_c0_seq1.p1  ORF type:complete len:749 (+),score=146.21 gnl/MRDRNA2_/MRDRNA2_96155_c0_seq1:118-2364(+)